MGTRKSGANLKALRIVFKRSNLRLRPSQSIPTAYAGPSDLRQRLIRSTAALALLRFVGFGLSFVLGIIIARLLSVAEFGTYTYILSWAGLLGTIGVCGLDRMMVRDVSAYYTQAAWNLGHGLLRWAYGVVLLVSFGLAGLVFISQPRLGATFTSFLPGLWPVVGLLIPLVALTRLQQSTLRGLHRPAGSQFAEIVLRPVLILFILAALRLGMGELTLGHVLAAYTVAVGLALTFNTWLVYRTIPDEARGASALYQHRVWLVSASHLLLLSSLDVVNSRIDILALGLFSGPEAVGIYAVVLWGAGLIPLVLNTAVMAIAPTFASLYVSGEREVLQRLVTRMSQLVLLGGIPIAIGMIFWGRWFLHLFGAEFIHGQTALIILSLGQLVNIVAGPVASLLTMTGHERDVVMGIGFSVGANFLLSMILIPVLGINGAATAAAISLVLWNVVLLWFVRQRLAISPTILATIGSRSPK